MCAEVVRIGIKIILRQGLCHFAQTIVIKSEFVLLAVGYDESKRINIHIITAMENLLKECSMETCIATDEIERMHHLLTYDVTHCHIAIFQQTRNIYTKGFAIVLMRTFVSHNKHLNGGIAYAATKTLEGSIDKLKAKFCTMHTVGNCITDVIMTMESQFHIWANFLCRVIKFCNFSRQHISGRIHEIYGISSSIVCSTSTLSKVCRCVGIRLHEIDHHLHTESLCFLHV